MRKILTGKSHKDNNSGFTLVELIVSMTITAVFATAVVAVLPSASRAFMKLQDMSRAQLVADMVVDSLREECADTYIEDFASARIFTISSPNNKDGADIITTLAPSVSNHPATAMVGSGVTGNVLLIRKSERYCEAIYSGIPITESNRTSVYKNNKNDANYTVGQNTSRAVYRLFQQDGENYTGLSEVNPGYVHFAYYECAFDDADVLLHPENAGSTEKTIVKCIIPFKQYDYTVPFSAGSYNGYTVDISFANFTYTTVPGMNAGEIYSRPSGVDVIVKVYKCSTYNDQSETNLMYTRTARLVFAEDTTR